MCFQLPCVLALPLYYYFSVSIVLIAQSGCSREPGCHGRFRLFSPAPALICSLLPAPAASSTMPPHKPFGEEGLMLLYSFPSSCNLMLIKTSAQGLATYRHKDYTGIPTQHLSVNAARCVKRKERRKKERNALCIPRRCVV